MVTDRHGQSLGDELDQIFADAPTPTLATETADAGVDRFTASHVPGTCSVHGQELVDERRLGIRGYGPQRPVSCPDPSHTDLDRDRCRWCGGPLIPPGVSRWHVSSSKLYCTDADRLRAFRANRRETAGAR